MSEGFGSILWVIFFIVIFDLVYLFGKLRATDFLPVKLKDGAYDDEQTQRGPLSESDDSMDEGIHFVGSSMGALSVEEFQELGHALGLSVAAQGVETECQLEVLRNAGCDFVQGFLMCRPLPTSALSNWVERGQAS